MEAVKVGAAQLNKVPAGILPFIGSAVKVILLHPVIENAFTSGIGLMDTVTVKVEPTQLPERGTTK